MTAGQVDQFTTPEEGIVSKTAHGEELIVAGRPHVGSVLDC